MFFHVATGNVKKEIKKRLNKITFLSIFLGFLGGSMRLFLRWMKRIFMDLCLRLCGKIAVIVKLTTSLGFSLNRGGFKFLWNVELTVCVRWVSWINVFLEILEILWWHYGGKVPSKWRKTFSLEKSTSHLVI
jgi:hypothetical protein